MHVVCVCVCVSLAWLRLDGNHRLFSLILQISFECVCLCMLCVCVTERERGVQLLSREKTDKWVGWVVWQWMGLVTVTLDG